jgi:magnesium-transporting ATPase (P-type)
MDIFDLVFLGSLIIVFTFYITLRFWSSSETERKKYKEELRNPLKLITTGFHIIGFVLILLSLIVNSNVLLFIGLLLLFGGLIKEGIKNQRKTLAVCICAAIAFLVFFTQ